MKPPLFLRIASILTLIHAVLHTVGGAFGKLDPGPGTVAVHAMEVNQFLLMGHMRSYADFYRGMGLGVTVFLTAEALLFWQLGSLSKTDGQRLRPILVTFLAAYTVLAVNSYAYFFVGPVITEILITACLGLAIFTARAQTTGHIGTTHRT